MNTTGRTVLIIVVLALLAAGSRWLLENQRPSESLRQAAAPGADYVLRDFTVRTFATDGTHHYTLTGEQLVHLPASTTAQVQQPRLVWETDEGAWTMRAERGTAIDIEARVVLEDQVNVDGPQGSTLNTERLVVLPEARIARTQSPVQVRHRGFAVDGTGAEVNLSQRNYQIQSAVEAVITPPSTS